MPEPVENVSEPAVSLSTPDETSVRVPVKRKTSRGVRILLWVLFVISIFVVSTGIKIKKKRLFPVAFGLSAADRQVWVERAKKDPYVNFVTARFDQAKGGIQYDLIAKEKIDEHVMSQDTLIIQQYLPNKEVLENMREVSENGNSAMAPIYTQSLTKWKKQRTKGWVTIAGGLVLFAVSMIFLVKT